ncbi:MAG: peptidylprolyl isomerase [Prolixibacteraceae bacterium]
MMIIKNRYTALILLIHLFVACSNGNRSAEDVPKQATKSEVASKVSKSIFTELANAVFTIQTYDEKRILEKGKGFLVNSTTIVAPFSLFKGATRAIITPLNGGQQMEITHYFANDRINNLILLQVENIDATPLKLYGASTIDGVKTTVISEKRNNTQPLFTGSCIQERIIQGRKLYNISNVNGKISWGSPVFVSNGSVLGMGISEELNYELNYFAVPASEIYTLLQRNETAKPLVELESQNTIRNAAVKGIVLETDFGDIKIKLYSQTPAYRNNFIKLAEEGYYDNLLIHRIIRDFGIQTGAADTRHAKFDDIVGWKGPGYTIPAHIVPGLYHKRGAIGSPRKADDKNHNRRSDGSQFYIVTGRKYLDDELDEFEEENGIKFTQEQRNVYKTIGGSPHLDGSYTVFGEVVSGLEVADRMTMLPVHGDFRPIADIRLKKVSIEY